ncbi:5-oxoprolinase subunit PxpB [Pontibacillus salicampi]|uniref:5-oxoprolinase subunit PxpB n=1 Tax=Pontibacillus salicampi TaxID=1449801 RepID=A0ABV6LK38_9BACI
MQFQLSPLGDHAIVIELGEEINLNTHEKVKRVSAYLNQTPFSWMTEYIPAFTTVTVFYDPLAVMESSKEPISLPYEGVSRKLEQVLGTLEVSSSGETRTVEIPVCYGGELGPDIAEVALHNQVSEEEVIRYHTNGDYLVYMIGFAPGFPYIGGMPEEIATPRKESPRLHIPAGSVGIAGKQTGVYPIETPGGWQLIGRTPLALFEPSEQSPTLLQAGDKIKFTSISKEEYNQYIKEASL